MYKAPLQPHLSDSDNRVIDNNVTSVRVYQVWKGNNKFFFGGRIVFGPDIRSIFLTISLIVIPVILFCAFVSNKIMHAFDHHIGILVVATLILLTLYDLMLLIITSGRDPGIVPRNTHPPEAEEDCSTMSTDWLGSQSSAGGEPNLPPTKGLVVNGVIVKVKYCRTCMLYRPPRCSHCSVCNNCVERFDHHCPWVGQCIGKRNYRFFFMFVSSTTVLCLYVFVFCCVNIKKIMVENDCSMWSAILRSPVSGVLIVYTFFTAWFVGGLTLFHLYLICTNQTTYENFRYRYDSKRNPYNRGCVHNVLETFASRIPDSKSNFRAEVEVESCSHYGSTMSLAHPTSLERPKTSLDIEVGKRQAVAYEDFEGVHSHTHHIDSLRGLERCGTQPRHDIHCDRFDGDVSPDISVLAADFVTDRGYKDRKFCKQSH